MHSLSEEEIFKEDLERVTESVGGWKVPEVKTLILVDQHMRDKSSVPSKDGRQPLPLLEEVVESRRLWLETHQA